LQQLEGRAAFVVQRHYLAVDHCILNIERGDLIGDDLEFLAKIFLVPGQYSRLISAAQHKSAVPIKLDFVDPVAGRWNLPKLPSFGGERFRIRQLPELPNSLDEVFVTTSNGKSHQICMLSGLIPFTHCKIVT
jgi:hypothetical protein